MGCEWLEREGDLPTQLLVDVLGYLGRPPGAQARFTSDISADIALEEFSAQNWSEFELEKQLSSRVSDVFLDLFNGFNQEVGPRGFSRYWASRGNWSREFAYYRADWRNHCSFWSSDEIGQLSSLIWNIEPAALGFAEPMARLRVRFQVDPYLKKAEFETKPPKEVQAFRDLKADFGEEMERLAEEKEELGYKSHWRQHQVGHAEVRLDPNGTLKDAAVAVWNKALELADLIDAALKPLRADDRQAALGGGDTQGFPSWQHFNVGPWTPDQDEGPNLAFQPNDD